MRASFRTWPLLLAACQAATEPPTTTPTDSEPASPAVAELTLVALDVWGRDLPGAAVQIDRPAPPGGDGVWRLPLGPEPLAFTVRAEAADHLPVSVVLRWDGETLDVLAPAASPPAAWVAAGTAGPADRPVHHVFLGLTHAWLAPSGPAPTLNRADLLINGEAFWASVADALTPQTRRVTWATWWWESDFELRRPPEHPTLTPAQRRASTALTLLEAMPDAERRVLVNLFGDIPYTAYLNTDADLRERAETPDDDFEIVLQPNPTEVPLFGVYDEPAAAVDFPARVRANPRWSDVTLTTLPPLARTDLTAPAASWHQKAIVIDGEVAFVSGMNTKAADWDTNAHEVFEPRRMAFDASAADRAAVVAREALPDSGPRRDYGVRVEGPAARDVEAMLAARWSRARDDGELYAEAATELALDLPAPAPADGVLTQVITTLPPPWSERSLFEAHAAAVAQATDYLYIEDQYFRSPMLLERIIARMTEVPDLRLIVVTKAVSDLDGGAQHTWIGHATLKALFPDRYLPLVLRALDLQFNDGLFDDPVTLHALDVDTHSKLRLIDDRWLSVGSCNFNNRGYLYEGELNVAVFDEDFAQDARRRIFTQLVGPARATEITDDATANFNLLAEVAANNEAVLTWWRRNAPRLDADDALAERATRWPDGLVYPLSFSDGYLFDVGPDAF